MLPWYCYLKGKTCMILSELMSFQIPLKISGCTIHYVKTSPLKYLFQILHLWKEETQTPVLKMLEALPESLLPM